MKLTALEPELLKRNGDSHWERVKTIDEADGIIFVCPKCLVANGMKRPGVHSVICWRPRVPQTTQPTPGRWEFSGTGLHDLTLTAKSSSIKLTGPGCGWHGHIRNGEVSTLAK